MHPRKRIALLSLFIAMLPLAGEAQIPRVLSYQGVLKDSLGNVKPDGAYTFTFRLYDVTVGGSPLWTEIKDLAVIGGLFSTYLGDTTPFGAGLTFSKPYWLGVKPGADPELVPRTYLASAAYSQNSLRADTAAYAKNAAPDGDWQESGSNIYRSTGNVGIGTSSPSYKLDVAGTVRAGSLTYTAPRTHYLSVSSEAFVPWRDVGYVNSGGNGGAYVTEAVAAQMNASIQLPDSAVITGVQWFFYDNSARDLSFRVWAQFLNGGGYESVASGSSSGTPGYSSVTATGLSYTVNNRAKGLIVQAYANPWDGTVNLNIKGAVVTYTIRGAD